MFFVCNLSINSDGFENNVLFHVYPPQPLMPINVSHCGYFGGLYWGPDRSATRRGWGVRDTPRAAGSSRHGRLSPLRLRGPRGGELEEPGARTGERLDEWPSEQPGERTKAHNLDVFPGFYFHSFQSFQNF